MSRKHQRSFQHSPWRAWFVFFVALIASVRPALGAEIRAKAVARHGVPSCCLGEDASSCCPADERDDAEQTYLPPCCGVDQPANAPELAPVPALQATDRASSVLQLLSRAVERAHTVAVAEPWSVHESERHAGLDPPLAPCERLVSTSHWWTVRGVLAALALLSVAQL